MKIHELEQGARFEYEGEEYVKSGPMFANGKMGQRLIPKYAVLKPIGAVKRMQEKTLDDLLSRDRIVNAFEAFYSECRLLIADDKKTALEVARNRFMQALD